ncbi:PREDICTED: nuclear polyadenylated RNA-binding protein 3 [Camelina sativa]|uniref:Nuclear polyadenylated RNA-binding protein 3 n=1 Tax=Camelina sativa TaxID=90675 RepID=A0ABM0W3J4_CAMSA|nr:PREDICTED: nuclear polyadenylated RNA-binding protein 3 [Camelina sativa]
MIGWCFQDPTYVLMRVLLCKIQCPSFICFCKPSPHIYASGSLKLENSPPSSQVSSSTATTVVDHDDDDAAHVEEEEEEVVDHVDDGLLTEVEVKKEEEEEEGHGNGEILKSSLRKEVLDSADGGVRREKKKVQWVDLMGKELAEIREFESSEEEDTRYDGDQSCVCVIL